MRPGWRRPALVGLLVAAAAGLAVVVNLALLGATGEGSLGTLNQSDPSLVGVTTRAVRPAAPAVTRTAPRAPATSTASARPVTTSGGGGGHGGDDSGGGGGHRGGGGGHGADD